MRVSKAVVLLSLQGLLVSSQHTDLHARDAAPGGSLLSPAGNDVWNNSNGLGLGEVIFQGVDTDFTIGSVTHVMTFSFDIYLETVDNSGATYYLAKGIAAENTNLDQYFQIPNITAGAASVAYRLVIDETQKRTAPSGFLSYTGRAFAPEIYLVGPASASGSLSGSLSRARRGLGPASCRACRRSEAYRRDSSPLGTLQTPTNDSTWTNSDGWGLGHIVYQGIDQDYTDGDVSHVTTHSIDIYLELVDSSDPPFYLARGIAQANLVVDVQFQIPNITDAEDINYRLVIDETQERQTSASPISYTIPSAAVAYININGPPTTSASATTSASTSSPTSTALSSSSQSPSGSSTSDVGAIAGGVVGGFCIIILVLAVILVWQTRRRRDERASEADYPNAEALVPPPTSAESNSPRVSEIPSTPRGSKVKGTKRTSETTSMVETAQLPPYTPRRLSVRASG